MRENRRARTPLPERWPLDPKEAIRLQKRLAARVDLRTGVRRPRRIAGCDVAYDEVAGRVFAAAVVFSYPGMEKIEEAVVEKALRFPYVPGLLSFREGPAVVEAVRRLGTRPDLLLLDGQGIAHPRRFGLASHCGVALGIPAIGCAKSRLVGAAREPGARAGSRSPLRFGGRVVGTVVRTRDGVAPLFVSPGHRMSVKAAADWTLLCCRGFRLPEPARAAHRLVTEARRRSRCVER